MSALCDPCHGEWLAWLDYRLPRAVPFVAQTNYDVSTTGVHDRMRSRFEEWRRTIREAQDRIETRCAAKHQFVPSAAGDQFVLDVEVAA